MVVSGWCTFVLLVVTLRPNLSKGDGDYHVQCNSEGINAQLGEIQEKLIYIEKSLDQLHSGSSNRESIRGELIAHSMNI